MFHRSLALLVCVIACGFASVAGAGIAIADWRNQKPDAMVDLRTSEGARLVNGAWRYHDAAVIAVDHRAAGSDLKPTGAAVKTHDLSPRAGAADFDDSTWEVIDPTSLEARRGNGRLSFNWYRISVTIPEKLGEFSTAGATAIFEIVVDDYSEVWVDGKLTQVLGESGGGLVGGWNAPNRVVLSRSAKPGDHFQIAVFGANAPLSDPPANFIWIRSATIQFFAPGKYQPLENVPFELVKFDPAIDSVVPPNTRLEKLADGFGFTEGPVWMPTSADHDGYLLFSDPNNNRIYRWTPDGDLSVFRANSGYTGVDIGDYKQPGSNGLAIDPRTGCLSICEHGNRRVTRLEKNGTITVLTDRYQGKRLNSPNDQVYRSDGTLYFTDPPFGLPRYFDDPRRELSFSGLFCLTTSGQLKLLSTDLLGPNGLAFSPDEKFLYVDDWDEHKKIVMRYQVQPDGSLSDGTVFADLTSEPGEEALDGLKVDHAGNVLVSGPGGIWIFSPQGKRLGRLKFAQQPANFAWGAGGDSLYVTARTGLYRFQFKPTQPAPIKPLAAASTLR